MQLEINTVKPSAKKFYTVNTSLMLRDRQGYGDEQSGYCYAVGTLREARKIVARLKREFDKPWTEEYGSRTVGFHNDVTLRKVTASRYDDLDPYNDCTWGDQEEIDSWSNEDQIPW